MTAMILRFSEAGRLAGYPATTLLLLSSWASPSLAGQKRDDAADDRRQNQRDPHWCQNTSFSCLSLEHNVCLLWWQPKVTKNEAATLDTTIIKILVNPKFWSRLSARRRSPRSRPRLAIFSTEKILLRLTKTKKNTEGYSF